MPFTTPLDRNLIEFMRSPMATRGGVVRVTRSDGDVPRNSDGTVAWDALRASTGTVVTQAPYDADELHQILAPRSVSSAERWERYREDHPEPTGHAKEAQPRKPYVNKQHKFNAKEARGLQCVRYLPAEDHGPPLTWGEKRKIDRRGIAPQQTTMSEWGSQPYVQLAEAIEDEVVKSSRSSGDERTGGDTLDRAMRVLGVYDAVRQGRTTPAHVRDTIIDLWAQGLTASLIVLAMAERGVILEKYHVYNLRRWGDVKMPMRQAIRAPRRTTCKLCDGPAPRRGAGLVCGSCQYKRARQNGTKVGRYKETA